jgi:putative transposase
VAALTWSGWQPSRGLGGRLQWDTQLDVKHEPCNKLTELERQRIIKVANEPEYADLPPSKIVPKLADKGIYIASESTYYRTLKEADQLSHRQKAKPTGQRKKPRALTATGPNQIYSWDITYCAPILRRCH